MFKKVLARSLIITFIFVLLSVGMPTMARAVETTVLPYVSPEIEFAVGTWTTEIQVTPTDNLFVTLQKTSLVSYGNSWDAELSIESGGHVIASTEGSHDAMLQLVNPQPGDYTIKVQAGQAGRGIVSALTSLPQLTFGDWTVGTIGCSYGSTWYQLEVPGDLEGIYFEAEAMGLWSQFDIYYQEYEEGEHWVSQQGVYTSQEIRNPLSGTYIVQFTDSAMLWTGNDWSADQTRDVLIRVGTIAKYGGIYFPLGEISFADEVADYQPGERVDAPCNNPPSAFGPPDYEDSRNDQFCSLGDGGSLTLKFTDNYLIDVEGYDLYIFEIGALEPFRVEISQDGTQWIDLGVVEGQPTELDIHGKVEPGEKFSYVRMTDVNASLTVYPWAGADIDAVGAIGARETSFAPAGYEPLINSFSPSAVGNKGPVTVEITGGWLDAKGTVTLSRTGYQDIAAQQVSGSPDLTKLTAVFDLAGKEPGDWNLTVTNPDGKKAVALRNLEIATGGQAILSVEIIGRSQLRIGRLQNYIIRVKNTGIIDAYDYMLNIKLPAELTFSLDSGLALKETVPFGTKEEGSTNIPVWIPKIDAGGQCDIQLQLQTNTSSASASEIEIATQLYEAPRSEYSATGKIQDIGKSPIFLSICDDIYSALQTAGVTQTDFHGKPLFSHLLYTKQDFSNVTRLVQSSDDILSDIQKSAQQFVWDLFKANTIPAVTGFVIGGFVACVILGPTLEVFVAGAAIGAMVETALAVATAKYKFEKSLIDKIFGVFPVDSTTPEDKYGPSGYDPPGTALSMRQRFIPLSQNMYYKVDFWNKEDARAPAYDVLVEDQLDTNLDWNSFRFEEIGFLDWAVTLEPCQYFNVNVDMRPAENLIVNVEGNFDPATGKIKWLFRSLDPDTMQTPDDPMAGFLPPISQSGNEVGWVGYSVNPKPDLANGTKLENQAFVEFDHQGDLLNHPAPKEGPYVNTIDTAAPASTVTGERKGGDISLAWTSDDHNGSGTKSYTIYVSKDNVIYEPWLTNTTETSGIYPAESNIIYSFYSVAVDNIGNEELPPNTPDVTFSPPSRIWMWYVIGGGAVVLIILVVLFTRRKR